MRESQYPDNAHVNLVVVNDGAHRVRAQVSVMGFVWFSASGADYAVAGALGSFFCGPDGRRMMREASERVGAEVRL